MKFFTAILKRLQPVAFWKKIIVVILMVGVATGAYFYSNSQTTSKPTYTTMTVEKGTLISSLTVSGSVSAASMTSVSSPTNGVITDLFVKNGTVVEKGTQLFSVTSTATQQEKAAAYATYLSAVNSVKTAEQSKLSADADMWSKQQAVLSAQNDVDYKNNHTQNPSTKSDYTDLERQQIESGLIQARKGFTAAETKFKEADSSLNAAKAQLTSAWYSYLATQDSTVTAPIGGTVANLAVTLGGSVSGASASSSSSSTSSTAVLVIDDFANVQVKATVTEVDISKIKEGQKATVSLDALPDKSFVGIVERADTIGTTSSGVVSYGVYLSLLSPPAQIQPGMTSTAIIQLDRRDEAISVPSSAIQTQDSISTVRVLKNNTLSTVEVETGLVTDTETEITAGLKEGDVVVTAVSTGTTKKTSTSSQTTSPFSGVRNMRTGGAGQMR